MQCCDKEMKVSIETKEYLELMCESCTDVIYIKKNDIKSRELLDD